MDIYSQILNSMETKYTDLTGFNIDSASDIGIRFKVLAGELSTIYEKLEKISSQAFPTTSTGEYLELHGQTRGLSRKGAVKAVGTLRFIRDTPAVADISIPSGIICSTQGEQGYRFITVNPAVLPRGATYVDVLAQANIGGSDYNAAANSIVIMITPASSINSVTNPTAFGGGVDEESDTALKSRIVESYSTISNGTNAAYYYQQAMKHDEVTSANVLPKSRGIGTVDVVVTSNGVSPTTAVLAKIKAELSKQKEINVDISVIGAVAVPTSITVSVAPVGEYDFTVLTEDLRNAVAKYMSSLRVGEPLTLAGLGNIIFNVAGVSNYKFTAPQADVNALPTRVITLGTLNITRMGA